MHRTQGEAASNFETITPGVVREKLLFCFLFLILFVLSVQEKYVSLRRREGKYWFHFMKGLKQVLGFDLGYNKPLFLPME